MIAEKSDWTNSSEQKNSCGTNQQDIPSINEPGKDSTFRPELAACLGHLICGFSVYLQK